MSASSTEIYDPRRDGERRKREQVPVRSIITTIALVVGTYLLWLFIKQTAHILELIAISAFFTVALNPAVDFCQQRLKIRRGYAISLVVFVGVLVVGGMLYLFVTPLVHQTNKFIDAFPQTLKDAREHRGPVGNFIQQHNLDGWLADNQAKIQNAVTHSTSSVLSVASTIASAVASFLTIVVLTILMLMQGPQMAHAPLIFFDKKTQVRISKVASDCSHAITGYMAGNLLISLIAGVITFADLSILGVDFAVVLAVWVAFADLIPLVGATLGAIPTIGVAFLHSTKAGIITAIVYVVYQQLENHVLQPTIMSRTVKINPLMVLVSVLIGVDLAGLLGALVSIPIAGIIQVVGRDIFDHRHHKLKGEPTIGADEIPVDDVEQGTLNPEF